MLRAQPAARTRWLDVVKELRSPNEQFKTRPETLGGRRCASKLGSSSAGGLAGGLVRPSTQFAADVDKVEPF